MSWRIRRAEEDVHQVGMMLGDLLGCSAHDDRSGTYHLARFEINEPRRSLPPSRYPLTGSESGSDVPCRRRLAPGVLAAREPRPVDGLPMHLAIGSRIVTGARATTLQVSTTSPAWAADLYLEMEHDGSHNLRASLLAAIRSAIRDRRLTAGATLPPSRQLAAQLGCARSVVHAVYTQLIAEGYLISRQGSGTRVARDALTPPTDAAWLAHRQVPRINFSAGVSDLSSFPRADWRNAVGHVMATVTPSELYYNESAGVAQFRLVLSERLARLRGVRARPQNVHICAGTVHAVSLLARLFKARGIRAVAVENPSWPRVRPPLEAAGIDIVPIRVDSQGLVVSDLTKHLNVGAVFVTPAHQFPTGVTLSTARRENLLRWAATTHGLIVEDDYDAEFNLGAAQVGSLQPSDPERIVYLGTTSKILSPTLRLGWLAAPSVLSASLNDMRESVDLGVSVIEQLSMAYLMSTGKLDRHLRQTRKIYDRRRNLLIEALRARLPHTKISGARAGLHIIASLPSDVVESEVVAELARRSVGVYGVGFYRIGRPRRPGGALVLGYASLNETLIVAGVDLIAESIAAARARAARVDGVHRARSE